jgi:hypothetical protein
MIELWRNNLAHRRGLRCALCRRPGAESPQFAEQVREIAGRRGRRAPMSTLAPSRITGTIAIRPVPAKPKDGCSARIVSLRNFVVGTHCRTIMGYWVPIQALMIQRLGDSVVWLDKSAAARWTYFGNCRPEEDFPQSRAVYCAALQLRLLSYPG